MDYVALDIETANSERSSICSIGLVKFNNNGIFDEYYTLINPEVPSFSDFNIEIHGITEDDVSDSPTFNEVTKDIESFIGDSTLVAHFSQFDMYAIQDAYYRYEMSPPENKYFCSYRLSKNLYELPSYRLSTMCSHFEISSDNHHNALADARMCANLVLSIFKDKNINIDEFNKAHGYVLGSLGNKGFFKKNVGNSREIELKYDESKHDVNHEFYQKNIAFTGALQAYTRAEIAQTITDIGANFNKGVLKSTNYLIVGNLENLERASGAKKSSKMIKAEKLAEEGQEIEILSELEFMQLL